ncbi:MAG: helix-turn-helix domain-containing protein [Ruminococcaceae bacterium]|nr:helix-turn-helix domain-containing protein [Oscillospiraceae bacterium]
MIHINSNCSGSSLGINLKEPFQFNKLRIFGQHPLSGYHYHNGYELCYITDGSFYYFIKDQTYYVKRGDFILINAYDIHSTSNQSNGEYERFLMNFKKEFFEENLPEIEALSLFNSLKNGPLIIQPNAQEHPLVQQLMYAMHREVENGSSGSKLFLRAALMQLLVLISRHQESNTAQCTHYMNNTHKTVSEISAYINNHYREDLTLSAIAEKFYISQYHFSRVFKKYTGFTFVEYYNNIRVKEAQRLLVQTNQRISMISSQLGFKSDSHFGRVFKQVVGISPLNYRKANRK